MRDGFGDSVKAFRLIVLLLISSSLVVFSAFSSVFCAVFSVASSGDAVKVVVSRARRGCTTVGLGLIMPTTVGSSVVMLSPTPLRTVKMGMRMLSLYSPCLGSLMFPCALELWIAVTSPTS